MLLSRVITTLEKFAPLRLAGKWDNVGLLIDHAIPISETATTSASPFKILLTNDLTLPVIYEAIASKVSLIITYHPTPFSALKKFPFSDVTSPIASKVVLLCARHDIAVFSPHTTWDCVRPGLNDWLIEGVCNEAIKKTPSTKFAENNVKCSGTLPLIPSDNLEDRKLGYGEGRIWEIPSDTFSTSPISLSTMVDSVKLFLNLNKIQLALPAGGTNLSVSALTSVQNRLLGSDAVSKYSSTIFVSGVSVCAGAGASLLPKVIEAARLNTSNRVAASTSDSSTSSEFCHVYITGEMSHHDLLSATQSGVAVILTGHTNCERGFLTPMAKLLESRLNESTHLSSSVLVQVQVSSVDADPLTIL
jgi:dinuclear metal center YbgI/SA1388 family protein